MTEGKKALALWRFVVENCYRGSWGTSLDALEHLNVYGYGYCGTFAFVLEPLWWTAGLTARHVNTGNHAATEVFYDNDWHYMDAHMRCFFLKKDNQSIASLEDLNNDPGLWDMRRRKESPQRGTKKYYFMTMHPEGHGISPIYSNKFTMAQGDLLALTWQKKGKWCLALMHLNRLTASKEKWAATAGTRPNGFDFFLTTLDVWRDWGRNPPPGEPVFYSYFPFMKIDQPTGKYYGNLFKAGKKILIERGRWYCMEMVLKANDPGLNNGEQAFWINGELIGYFKNIIWRFTNDLKINSFTVGLYIHENEKINRIWYDDIMIGTGFIGLY